MNSMKLDLSGLAKFSNNLTELQNNKERFFREATKELAARLLAKVIPRTPVGVKPKDVPQDVKNQYWKGYVGGTLRRGWTAKTEEEAKNGKGNGISVVDYIEGVAVVKEGSKYRIVIINPVKYASYVEYGHRQEPGRFVPALGKRLKASFVEGQYMLTISEKELQEQAPAILHRKLRRFLREAFT